MAALVTLIAACAEAPTAARAVARPDITQAQLSGLIHLWSGDGDGRDVVGGADGVLGQTTGFVDGVRGKAFSFDLRQSSIVMLPVNIGPTAHPTLTMGMWVKLRSAPAGYMGWVLGHDNGNYDRSLALTDSRYGYGVAGGTGWDPANPSRLGPYGSILLNLSTHLDTWHCVAVTYDAPGRVATFYADGRTQTVAAEPGEGAPEASLGGLFNYAKHTVDAAVDEVFMYDRVLSPGELNTVCDAATPPSLTFAIDSSTLWPVNKRLVTVAKGISATDLASTPSIDIAVTANEPITNVDYAVLRHWDGTVDVQVRADRNGKGAGRVYTITATAWDDAGNSTSRSGTVTVPHDLGPSR